MSKPQQGANAKLAMAELLLAEFEHLTYNQRMRRIIELGRSARTGDANAKETIALLSQGSLYERLLAVQTCYSSRDLTPALVSLSHPSLILRSHILRIIVILGSDADAQQVLIQARKDGPLKELVVALRRLRRRGRYAVIDPLVESEDAGGTAARVRVVLAFASEELVGRLLPKWVETFDLVDWKRLAVFRSKVACEWLQTWAMSLKTLDQQLLQVVNALLPTLANNAALPRLAIDLVKTMHKLVPLEKLDLYMVIQRHPREIAGLLLASRGEGSGGIYFTTVAGQLETEQLLALFEYYPRAIDRSCLKKLRPEQRKLVYKLGCRGWRGSNGNMLPDVVELLPQDLRINEAKWSLGLSTLRTRPLERLQYAKFLDWKDALENLEKPLRSNDAAIRALALRGVIGAAQYHPEHLDDALQWALRSRNDQDPVRWEILDALTAVPPSYWQEKQLPSLSQVIRDALDASDLSSTSTWSLLSLLKKLLPFYSSWAAAHVALLYREREDMIGTSLVDEHFSPTVAQHLATALSPLVESWQKRGKADLLTTVASSFGRQLHVFSKLLAALEELALDISTGLSAGLKGWRSGVVSTGQMILSTIQDHMPEHMDALVPRLLQPEQGFFYLGIVREHLSRRRQDLLTQFLDPHRYEENGASPLDISALLQMEVSGFPRWTMAQHSLLAQTLLSHAQRGDTPVEDIFNALRQLTALSFLSDGAVSALIPFVNDKRVVVRNEALRALGRLDAVGQGIPTLLEALQDGDQARIAIHALRPALKRMSDSKVIELLYAVPRTKVTVMKEMVRLIGELGSDEAYRYLIDMEKNSELHRDVRIAVLELLCSSYIERSESWDVLGRAARDSNPVITNSVIRIPTIGLSRSSQQKLLDLFALILQGKDLTLRQNVLFRLIESPIPDPQQLLAAHVVELTKSRLLHEMSAAINVLLVTYGQDQPALVMDMTTRLQGLEKRKHLSIFINAFLKEASSDRQRYLATTTAILKVLAQDRLTLSLRLKLILSALPWQEAQESLLALCSTPSVLHPDALVTAEHLIQEMSGRADANLRKLERTLTRSPDEGLRRLALSALVAQSQQIGGWTQERRTRLEAFRQDASVLVAEAAQFICPAEDWVES